VTVTNTRRSIRLVGLAVAYLLLFAGHVRPATAADDVIVFPSDASLAIDAVVAQDSPIRSLRLRSRQAERKVRIEASDLAGADGLRLDRSQIRITQDGKALEPIVTLRAEPTDFRVVIGASSHSGSFSGELRVTGVDADPAAATVIPVTLLVRSPASLVLTAIPEKIAVPLVNGTAWLRTTLTGIGGAVESYPVAFRGAEPLPFVASATLSALRGDTNQAVFPSGAAHSVLSPDGQHVLVTLNARDALPDRYTGTLTVRFAGVDRPVDVPVEAAVRTHPLWVLYLILFGVLLGRFAKWSSERGVQVRAGLDKIERFAMRIQRYPVTDQGLFDDVIARMQQLVADRDFTKLDAEVVAANARADLLERLNQLIEMGPIGQPPPPALEALRPRIRTDANDGLVQLQKDIEAAAPAPAAPRGMFGAGGVASQPPPTPIASIATLARQAALRSRAGAIRDFLAVRLGMPILGVVVVVILAFIGFQTIYGSAATFGSKPINDALSALLWGLSADVAGRTITNLPPTR
jgi:hypothetical protein